MVEQQVDARSWDQGGQTREQIEGLEHDGARAVAPGAADVQEDSAVGQALERILSDGWAQDVAAEMLEATTVASPGTDTPACRSKPSRWA